MKSLAGNIRTLSATTGIAANELAEGFYRFASAGLDARTSLAGMQIQIIL
jgi:hypothetical protein